MVFSTTSQELKPLSKGHFEKTLSVRFEKCDFGSAEVLNDILRHIYIYSVIKLNQDLTKWPEHLVPSKKTSNYWFLS